MSMKTKRTIKIFRSHEEQEKADIKHYKRMSPGKKLEELEEIRRFFFQMKYGTIPRLRRICRVIKRKRS